MLPLRCSVCYPKRYSVENRKWLSYLACFMSLTTSTTIGNTKDISYYYFFVNINTWINSCIKLLLYGLTKISFSQPFYDAHAVLSFIEAVYPFISPTEQTRLTIGKVIAKNPYTAENIRGFANFEQNIFALKRH